MSKTASPASAGLLARLGPTRIAWALALAAATFLMSLYAPLAFYVKGGLSGAEEHLKGGMYYSIAFLSADYFDFGFIRRGLGGTLARLLSDNGYHAAFAFHLLSALLLVAAIVPLHLRLVGRTRWVATAFMAVFLAFSPQTFAAWSYDEGRTDMLVMAVIAAAALAHTHDRPFLAAALLWFGSLAHETALIFGVPLLAALSLSRGDGGSPRRRQDWRALALLVGLVAVTMTVQYALAPSRDELVAGMLARIPTAYEKVYEDLRDCAIYMMVTGLRGLRTALCFNGYYPWYPLMVLAALGVALASALALGLDRRPVLFLLSALLPMLFMNLVANDVGRWLKFAVAGSWILSCVLQSRGQLTLGLPRVVLGTCVLMILVHMGITRVHQVSPWVSAQISWRFGWPPYPDTGEWMTQCDPDWRDVVHEPPAAARH